MSEKKNYGVVDGNKLMRIVNGSLDLDDFHREYFESFVKASRIPLQPPAKIEAAETYWQNTPLRFTVANIEAEAKNAALRWVLGQISDKDFGLQGGEEE